MPQAIDPVTLDEALTGTHLSKESIPSLEGASHYFSVVMHKGRRVLCILGEDAVWRPAQYQEMMELVNA